MDKQDSSGFARKNELNRLFQFQRNQQLVFFALSSRFYRKMDFRDAMILSRLSAINPLVHEMNRELFKIFED